MKTIKEIKKKENESDCIVTIAFKNENVKKILLRDKEFLKEVIIAVKLAMKRKR